MFVSFCFIASELGQGLLQGPWGPQNCFARSILYVYKRSADVFSCRLHTGDWYSPQHGAAKVPKAAKTWQKWKYRAIHLPFIPTIVINCPEPCPWDKRPCIRDAWKHHGHDGGNALHDISIFATCGPPERHLCGTMLWRAPVTSMKPTGKHRQIVSRRKIERGKRF